MSSSPSLLIVLGRKSLTYLDDDHILGLWGHAELYQTEVEVDPLSVTADKHEEMLQLWWLSLCNNVLVDTIEYTVCPLAIDRDHLLH